MNEARGNGLESKVKGIIHNQSGKAIISRGNVTDPVINNNININKISINNFYNRQDAGQELYSMRSNRLKKIIKSQSWRSETQNLSISGGKA